VAGRDIGVGWDRGQAAGTTMRAWRYNLWSASCVITGLARPSTSLIL